MRIDHNVTFNVLDEHTGKVVRSYSGHNQATNSMLVGIAHYLVGDGVLNQGTAMLSKFVPKYISLGTMGLGSQEEWIDGTPKGIGDGHIFDLPSQYVEYMQQVPGYGADGYDVNQNNNRFAFGLGPKFGEPYTQEIGEGGAIECELVSDTFPRSPIVYREIIPEIHSEIPQTIDIVFSAMISTGALAQFRGRRDHIFITEAGLWSRPDHVSTGDNGLLAAYRIIPPDKENWDMAAPGDQGREGARNRQILREQILRVDINQVVQVIWKIQIGSINQFYTGDSNA